MRATEYWIQRALREKNLTSSIDQLNTELARCYRKAYERIYQELEKLYLEIMKSTDKVLISHLYQYNRYYEIMNLIEQEAIRLGKQEESLFRTELTGIYEFNRKLLDPSFNAVLNQGAIQDAINRY